MISAKDLGPDFEPVEAPLPRFRHRGLGVEFALVPGGTFEMGYRDLDRAALEALLPIDPPLRAAFERLEREARPVREVTIAPFLVAALPLRVEQVRRVPGYEQAVDTFTRQGALGLARAANMRLPSEAELEWLAREGGRFSFVSNGAQRHRNRLTVAMVGPWGVQKLVAGEWAADDWHDSYAGAPLDGRAWLDGGEGGVSRGALPFGIDQDEHEIALALACHRARGEQTEAHDRGRLPLRLALDLPLR